MKFELDSLRVKSSDLFKPWQIESELRNAVAAFAATPMILPRDCEEDVTKGELRLSQIAGYEIRLLRREPFVELGLLLCCERRAVLARAR